MIGSGNIVHNLRMMDWQNDQAEPYSWALSFSETVERCLQSDKVPEALLPFYQRKKGNSHTQQQNIFYLHYIYLV